MNALKIVCFPVYMSICKKKLQYKNKRYKKIRINERRVTTRETVTAKKDCSGITVLSETWFICLIGIPFMSFWSQFAWKQVNYLVGTQWPVPASPGILTSQEVFPAKVKGKSCFSRRKIPVAVMDYIYPFQLCLKMSPYSLLKMHSAIYSVLVKPQANFLGHKVPQVFQQGQVLVSFS